MYTREQLESKRPVELLEIVLQLQNEIESKGDLISGLSANQLSEETALELIKIVLSEESPFKRLKNLMNYLGV